MLLRFTGFMIAAAVFFNTAPAQKIVFSEPDRDDPRAVNFEVIGKMNGNILTYKSYSNRYKICLYDNDMKLVGKTDLSFLPDKIINSDVVAFRDFFYFIYQYQKRNIVYCMAAKINAQGTIEGEPKQLDTTAVNIFTSNKIYTVITSEDKQKINVLKINSKDPDNFIVTNSLFDAELNIIRKTRDNIPMPEHNDFLDEFQVDNNGDIVFLRSSGTAQNDNINQLTFITRRSSDTSVAYHTIDVSKIYLDDIKIKINNQNNSYLLTSFFSKSRRGNIDGLYVNVWNAAVDSSVAVKYISFNEELRNEAKSKEDNAKTAFNNNYIQKIIMRKDGGFIIISEAVSSTSRNNSYNRWDYLNNSPFWSPGNYYYYNYSPYSYYYPWYNTSFFNQNNATRYYADNITALSFDSSANTEWTNVLHKSQFDDNTDNLLGFTILNTGGELHFLFNQLLKRQNILTDQSITPDGELHLQPTLHNLDNSYEFMPRYGKQVGAREIIIPCTFRNSICFAKVNF